MLPEKIERVDNVAWATDNKTIFYVTEDAVTKRSDKFFRHVLGTDKTDLVYEEKDELFDIGVGRSRDKAVILLGAYSKTSTELRYHSRQRSQRGLENHRAAPGRSRIRRRSSRRPLLHSHQQGREELSRGDRAGRRSVGEELERVRRAPAGGEDRRHRSVRRSRRCCRSGKTACSRSRSSTSRPTSGIASSFPSRSTPPA